MRIDPSEMTMDPFKIVSSVLPAGGSYGPYSNPYWEFSWIIDGGGTARIAGTVHHLRPNTVLLIPPDTENFYVWLPNRPTRQGLVLFHAPGSHDWPQHRELDGSGVILTLFRHILWLNAEQPPGWQRSAQGAVEYAVQSYVTGHADGLSEVSPTFSESILRVISALRQLWGYGRWHSPPLQDLADVAGLSREHLCRVFAREIGTGPITAIRFVRLNRAATLLAQTNLSVREVSRETGFESEFHFSRAFKATIGTSPSAFRSRGAGGFELPPPLRRFASQF